MTKFVVSILPLLALVLLWVFLIGPLRRWLSKGSQVEEPVSRAESVEPPDDTNRSGTIHTYRDPEAYTSNDLGPRYLIACFLLLLLASQVVINPRFTLFNVLVLAFCVVGLVAAYVFFREERDGNCGEIRLGDDGTCELETKRRVIRLDVVEILSVKYWRDSENTCEHYTIHFRGGKLNVTQRMKDFLDFLNRLRALNPRVDLSSFPTMLAGTWPDAGGPAREEQGNPVNRFFRSALFPLIVIALLVYLLSQTIIPGK